MLQTDACDEVGGWIMKNAVDEDEDGRMDG